LARWIEQQPKGSNKSKLSWPERRGFVPKTLDGLSAYSRRLIASLGRPSRAALR
jgi:hypothetical protein